MDLFAALGEDLGAGRWSVRAADPSAHRLRVARRRFIMALGGCARGVRSSLSNAGAAGRPRTRAPRRLTAKMRVTRFLLPRRIFLVWRGVLYIGVLHSPEKSTMHRALLGRPAPEFVLPALGGRRRSQRTRSAGQAVGAERLGHLVRRVPRGAPVLLDIARRGEVPLIGLNWRDEDPAALAWLAKLGNPYAVDGSRSRRPHRDRLRRVRRARNFLHRCRTVSCSTATSAR